jgi:hypothetical protein
MPPLFINPSNPSGITVQTLPDNWGLPTLRRVWIVGWPEATKVRRSQENEANAEAMKEIP